MVKKVIFFVGMMLLVHTAYACDIIQLEATNHSTSRVTLQPNSEQSVHVDAGEKKKVAVEVISYKEKFCSVVVVTIEGQSTVSRYVLKPKAEHFSLDIDKENSLTVKGLTGPLAY